MIKYNDLSIMNKERIMSKVAYEAALSIPAALIWFGAVGPLFEDRPLSEKIARVGVVTVITVIGTLIAWRIGAEAYSKGYRVDKVWSDSNDGNIKKR